MPTPSDIQKLPAGRTQCTLTFTEEEVSAAEEGVLRKMAGSLRLPGFRPGMAPANLVREKVNKDELFERTIRDLLPGKFEMLVKEHDLHPIAPPKIEVKAKFPLSLLVTFVERPQVTLKGLDKIKIDKKEVKVDEKEVQKMVDYLLGQHRTFKEVEHEAKEGHQVTMDFTGADGESKEIPGIRTAGYPIILGSKQLIPGFEEQMAGMKKGEEKSFQLTFPAKYHAKHLQNKPVTFSVKVSKVEAVETPALTDEFVTGHQMGTSAASLRKEIEDSMKREEEMLEKRRRESALFEAIAKATQMELAPELIEQEEQVLIDDFSRQLAQQNLTFEDWMKRSQRTPEQFRKEMQEEAKRRLTLRFGLDKALEEKKIEVTDEEMATAVSDHLQSLQPEQQEKMKPHLVPGHDEFEQLRWQRKIEKFVGVMLA